LPFSAAWGYYPPLQATATATASTVTYSVFNPQTQQGIMEGPAFLGTVTSLQQHNGVIAWSVNIGTDYYVDWTTFDPALNRFQSGWQGPFTSVAQLQVVDGVVAFIAGIPPSISDPAGHLEFKYLTYDPAKAGWMAKSYYPHGGTGISLSDYNIATKDGVLVMTFRWTLSGSTSLEIRSDIYDSAISKWFSDTVAYGPEVIFNDSTLTCTYTITNATINTNIYHPTLGYLYSDIWGYDPGPHHWYHGNTIPLAYFVAQPTQGPRPLWVWFTDMSIAGTNWNWNFGDYSGSTSRSPYHKYIRAGNFLATQQVNASAFYSRTITVNPKGLPGILQLLLLAP
jgi:hypothetical protein